MPQVIKPLSSGDKVIFDQGRFDAWCVYVVSPDGRRFAPHDETYFSDLYEISKHYPKGKVYEDFVKIYDLTSQYIDPTVTNLIDVLTKSYHSTHQAIVEQWFTVIYAGMIAEENKHRAILKKRIKRLGMYQVLMLEMPAPQAANFSRGKKWQELDHLMSTYGF